MEGEDELVHEERLSPNFDDRSLPVTMAVLHYTEMKPVETALERMCDPAAAVSAHYCITEEGEVIRPMLASAAFPGVFTPMKIADSYYVDGGALNNFPVDIIKNYCDQII